MKSIRHYQTKNKGLTLIELLIYAAVASIFIVLILSIVNSFFKSRNTVRKLSVLENSLAYVFNDLTQEIHWSNDATIGTGALNLSQNGESPVTITYELGDQNQLLKDDKPITPPQVRVTTFEVKNVAPAGKIKCLEITLELEHAGAEPKILSGNKTTISLRKTQFQPE